MKRKKSEAEIRARLEEERLAQMEARAGLAVSKNAIDFANLLKDKETEPCPPLYNITGEVSLSSAEKRRLYMAYAAWAAKDGLPLSAFEKEGFKLFCEIVGLPRGPCAETVRKYQGVMAAGIMDSIKVRLAAICEFSPLPLISLQTDVWTSHDGPQQTGVRVTACNPITLNMENAFLPLETTVDGSLDAEAEARLVSEAFKKLSLHPTNVYSQTTDFASVPLAGVRRNNIVVVPCLAHQTALVLNDCLNVKIELESRDMDLDQIIQESDVNDIDAYLVGVAARSSHFNRSALARRLLEAWQLEKNLKPLNFITWSPTRWTGVYEAALRDYHILLTAKEFVANYVKSEKFTQTARKKLLPDKNTLMSGRMFISILFPLYSLTLKLQEDDISLAQAFLEAFDTWQKLKAPIVTFVDEHGKETKESMSINAFNDDFVEFRRKLTISLKARVLDKFDDEILISVVLDPQVYTVVEFCATEEGHFDNDVVEFAKDILRRMNQLSSDIVMRLVDIIKSRRSQCRQSIKPTTPAGRDTVEDEAESSQDLWDISLVSNTDDHWSENSDSSFVNNGGTMLSMVKRLRKSKEAPIATNEEDEANNELNRYHAKRKMIDDIDALSAMNFWSANASEFPNLYHLFVANRGARPAHTTRLESCFSMVGLAVPPQRASIKMGTLNDSIMIKSSRINPSDVRDWATSDKTSST